MQRAILLSLTVRIESSDTSNATVASGLSGDVFLAALEAAVDNALEAGTDSTVCDWTIQDAATGEEIAVK